MEKETLRLSNCLDKKAAEWTHGDSKRVNFLAIDTAKRIRSVSKDLDRKANWNHVLFIPRDSPVIC